MEPEPNESGIVKPVPEVAGPPRVWGAWPTFGLGIAVIVVSVIVQAIIAVIFFVVELVPMDRTDFDLFDYSDFMSAIDMGLLLSLSIIISAIACLGLIYVFVKANRGVSFNDYVGFKSIGFKKVAVAVLLIVGFLALSLLVNYALDIPAESDVMTDAYLTSVWPALFWIATIIFAPLFEEVFFRGFLFEGFRYSRLGAAGAIFVTSLVWAGFHLQYGLFQIASIFVLGIVLGVVRYRTDSLWPPIIMHALNNLLAVLFITVDFGI